MKYSEKDRQQAKTLFINNKTIPEISEELNIEKRTLYSWSKEFAWEAIKPDDVYYNICQRICILTKRDKKSDRDLNELDHLITNMVKLEKLKMSREKLRDSQNPDDLRDSQDGSTKSKKRKRNNFIGIPKDEILEKFKEGLFEYQLNCWEHIDQRTRNILKSRQIGMTYYFAREAFTNALLTGDNQIFLSASRAQSDVFREYIKEFAFSAFGVDIVGKDKVAIKTDHGTATLYFLSNNSSTAQSYHGHVYIDEYFWISKFKLLQKVATAMASQKRWRKTYFSTPSAKSHEAYPMWSGDEYNERLKKASKAIEEFPSRKELRKNGILCIDGQWRKIITLDDAEAGGCDLFDQEQLKLEYSPEVFKQLFRAYFVDDSDSVFKLSQLLKCQVDPSVWKWLKPDKKMYFPVWIGYDPSRIRDGACIVVIKPPIRPGDKFYVIEKITLHNKAWAYQAEVIKGLIEKYNVDYIGMDLTGPGSGVYEMVQYFYPAVDGIFYTLDKKTRLILKAQSVISEERIEWDVEHSDIPAGFMQIHRAASLSGQIIYHTNRSDTTGHADAAWAIMHALVNEDLIYNADDEVTCSM